MKPHKYQQGRRGRPSPQVPCIVCGVSNRDHASFSKHEIVKHDGEGQDCLTFTQVAQVLQCSVSFLQGLVDGREIVEVKLAPQNAPRKQMKRIMRKELVRYLDELEARSMDDL